MMILRYNLATNARAAFKLFSMLMTALTYHASKP